MPSPPLIGLLFLGFLLTKLSQTDCEKLYGAIKNGDQDAFKEFYDSHFASLFHYVKNRGVQSDAAEDLIQKAFIYIWENRANIKPDQSLKSYLFRIAFTRTINYLNERKTDLLLSGTYKDDEANPLEYLQFKDLNQSLIQAMKQMPEMRRTVFEHCFINELTYKETAEILDIAPKTVENHMGYALRDIRGSLKQFLEY